MRLTRFVGVLLALSLAAISGVATAGNAEAASRNGFCETGEFCYYYNTGLVGSVSDFTTSVADYGTNPATCYVFKTPGYAGYNQCIKNNAAAVYNMSSQTVRIYYNSGYAGASLSIAPGEKRNLSGTALYNNNASHQFLSAPPPPPSGGVVNPYPGMLGANGGWTPRAAWLKSQIKARYPALTCSTYVSPAGSDHATGNAMDCFGDLATRRALQYWVAANAPTLQVWYVIHERRIYSLTYPSAGWKLMADAGSVTKNHYDHVHISMQSPTKEF